MSVVSEGLEISAPYSDDDNTNNSLLIEWGLDGVDFSLGSQALTNSSSPYNYAISPLINGNSYQVRITYQDPDNADIIQTRTGLLVYNPLIHNSWSTGSTDWSGDGGWGVAGGKYGEYTCQTCHVKTSTNIKYIRTSINIPDLPGDGQTITFLSTVDGSSDYGDDSIAHATSDKICEVCHSLTNWHNNDRADNTINTHSNKADCTSCHRHSKGFAVGSCDSCHGGGTIGSAGTNYWPDGSNSNPENDTAGRHLKHMDALSQLKWGYDAAALLNQSDYHTKQLDLCGYCHSDPGGATHRDATTDTAFANAWDKASNADGSYSSNNCSNINCHNSKATGSGTYGWTDAGTSACIMCHVDVTDSGNSSGETHLAHTSGGFGISITCATCHAAATNWSTNTKPGSNHLNGTLEVGGGVTYSTAGSYDGTQALGSFFGGCSTNDCHNNGKNGAPRTPGYTWGTAIAGCAACHGDDSATLAEGHDAHLDAATLFGATIGCDDCHGTDAETQNSHIDKDVTLSGLTYGGDTAITGSTYGGCGTNSCHENGAGGDPANTSYSWDDTGLADCTLCHSNAPSSGAHSTHISTTTYGPHPSGSTDCGECHAANGNNTSMNGFASHLDGNVDFTGGVLLAAATDCNSCHGGATPAVTAKTNWAGATAVTCESCHGGGDAAAVISSTTAPARTTNFTSTGHGRTDGAAPNRACTDCHDNSSAHISGSLDDTNRIKTISTKNFDTGGEENDWCNGCHASAMPIHYANSRTSGGTDTSDDGIYCYQCHDPHGNSGYDAMIAAQVGNNRTIAAFNDRTARGDYVNASFDGICQVCHQLEQAGQVDHFNRSENAAHNPGNCIDCHAHDDDEAFKPSGCTGCHGNEAAETSWPDSDPADTYNDRLGSHVWHTQRIGDWIADPVDGTEGSASLENKNATCVYCHPDPGGNNRDGNGHDTNTTGSSANLADIYNDGVNLLTDDGGNAKFRYIEDGSLDPDGSYDPTIKRCSNIDCHSNGDFTWTWYEDAVAPGAISDLAAATGSTTGTVKLTWIPPDNDGTTGPISYGYEVRYSTSSINAGNWASATLAGGPPPAIRDYGTGETQEMTVYGLTPGTTYYFAVKAFDEVFSGGVPVNYASISNSPSAVAKTDTTPPVFLGLDDCQPAFVDGAVDLSWIPARDESDDITYRIWVVENAAVDFSAPPDYTIEAPGSSFQVTGLTNGNNYYFGVRAEDVYGNRETNTIEKEAIPQLPAENEWLGRIYYTDHAGQGCGAALNYGDTTMSGTMSTSGWVCAADQNVELRSVITASTTVPVLEWTAENAYDETTNIQGASMMIYDREWTETNAQEIRVALGHDGGGWTQIGYVDHTIRIAHRGNVTVGLSSLTGQIPAGNKLVVRIYKTAVDGDSLRFRFASENYRSLLTVYEQAHNSRPGTFTVNTPSPAVPAGDVALSWSAAADPDGDTVYYNVYGSTDGGVSYPYIIAKNITATSATWKTNDSGVILASGTASIKVAAGDGLSHNESGTFYSHREATSTLFTIDNTLDGVDPAAVTDLTAEHRPKAGTVWLSWSAPGDDGMLGQASQYDIRYKLADINADGDELDSNEGPIDSAAKWASATTVSGEPVPIEPSFHQGYEVLGLQPEVKYYFAIKTSDEAGRWSALSNSPSAESGQKCGVCHSTPPDEVATKGTHARHGFTQKDCSKCHGEEADTSQTVKHSDGVIKLAWNNPKFGYFNTADGPDILTDGNVVYNDGAVNIYTDSDGGGGFNDINQNGGTDSGTCSGFNASGVTGCHGTGSPVWNDATSVNCAMCHGDPSRTDKDPYGRTWEDTSTDDSYRVDYSGSTPIYKAAPGIDLHGNSGDSDYVGGTERYTVGQHLRHLNFSYRLTGDQCDLCHLDAEHAEGTMDIKFDAAAGNNASYVDGIDGTSPGTCMGTSTARCHGNNAEPPTWETRTPYLTGSKLVYCSECHGHEDNVYWQGASKATADAGHSATVNGNLNGDDVATTLTVQSGHDMVAGDRIKKGGTFFKIQSVTSTVLTLHKAIPTGINFSNGEVVTTEHIPHTFDDTGSGLEVQACTHCHVEGHPQGDETGEGRQPAGEETIFIPNYSLTSIDYTSGGIHLRQVINGRSTMNDGSTIDTEAEICWGCHEDNGISEWGTNTDANTGSMVYNYGSLDQTGWVSDAGGTATWSSYNFPYKTAALQSTHTGNGNPSETPAGPGVDPVEKIRCSYCHDVHDMNHALDDTVSGKPYLRGTWMGNPYKEDGAPGRYDANHDGSATYAENPFNYYDYNQNFGPVPRGNNGSLNKMGGYWIDQNSGFPTATWTLASSAGLCVRCHGANVNDMNKFGTASDDWVGTNGHSNAAIGGSGIYKANIFNPADRGAGTTATQPNMAYQSTSFTVLSNSAMYGLRNAGGQGRSADAAHITDADGEGVYPYAHEVLGGTTRFVYGEFTWGVDFSTTTAELSYHRFSCSKCHNPHASRLPRLMITNCLDVAKNKWDNIFSSDSVYTGGNSVGDPDWTTGEQDSNGVAVDWKNLPVMTQSGTGNDPSGDPRNKQFAYATSAQNCHRYIDENGDGDAEDAGEEQGWNKVTPWVESGANFSN